MRQVTYAVGLAALCCWAIPAHAGTLKCPPDSVKVGNVCIDTYEASVWQIPPSNTALVNKVQQGKATLADLTGGGATQLAPAPGCDVGDYGIDFPDTGNWTPVLGSSPPSPGVYAVSIPGVKPSACITWFQANQACRLSGKRLVRNDEWQAAAQRTPDPGNADDGSTTCATSLIGGAANTGSRSSCKSIWGLFDMVGNVAELVADWADSADSCTTWSAHFGNDYSCFGGSGSALGYLPSAMVRGGSLLDGGAAGVFAGGTFGASDWAGNIGFRCAR